MRRLTIAAALGAACTLAAAGPLQLPSRPLPDEDAFYAAARDNLARALREQWRYAYKERRTELHRNPFGRLGTGSGISVYEVTPGENPNVWYRRLIEKDGKPVPNSRPERQEQRERAQSRSGIDDAISVLRFSMERRDRIDGRDAIVVAFEPRPGARPETREGRLARLFKGHIWVDEAAREVMRIEATAIDDISYGLGLVAWLNEGTEATLTRERVDDRIWLPTSMRFKGRGRALLVRRLTIDHVIEWFDYRRVR
jgi:hypothetical protein